MKPAPRNDQHDEALRVTAPEPHAAGIPGVVAAMRQLVDHVGVGKAARTMLRINQPDGFDCPGCAWPESAHTSRFEFCENGAKAIAEEATDRTIGADFFAAHSLADLATHTDYWLGQQGRLIEPMYRPDGADHYEPITWDAAFALVGQHLRALPDPNRAVFYTSGRTSNEAAFSYQLFVRELGTNNLPDCSNMCHESSGVALSTTIGIGKGTVTLEDVHQADVILVIGQNPGTNHPRMLSALETAKRRGARIVSINPLREAGLTRFRNPQKVRGIVGGGTELADRHLPIAVGADLALFQLVNARLVAGGHVDQPFVDEYCDGYDDLTNHLAALDQSELLAATGLAEADVDALVGVLAGSPRIVACWAMGLTQHRQAVATIQEIANTLLLRGAIGQPGAGLCPVRGHSNVQGDRTMGIYERPSDRFLETLGDHFGFEPPADYGYDVVEAIEAMATGRVDVFVAMGGNFISAAPDTAATIAAMERCALTVQVSTKLNRSHVHPGREALILPCLGRTETDRGPHGDRFVTVEDSMGVVHASRGTNRPASTDLLSEVDIVAGIASATLGGERWAAWGSDYDTIRDHIASVIPGCEDYNVKVRVPGGFALPNGPRDTRTFATATGSARLTVNHFDPVVVPPGRLLLQTVRSHDQYNTTIYGLDDRYRGISQGRRVVFVNGDDLAERGLDDGDHVDLVSEWTDGVERRAESFRVVAYDTPRGCCAAYFPEANALVPLGSIADGSRTPTSKAVIVRLEPTAR